MILQYLHVVREPEGRPTFPGNGSGHGPAPGDALFLALVVAISCLPYVAGLGLYSDDWGFLARMHTAGAESLREVFRVILADNMHARPVQALNLAVLYGLFGLDPLGYHVVNSVVLVLLALLFHALLRELGMGRELALAISLVFALLPHYSTDRFWIAAFQANLALLWLFVSVHADLRFIRATRMASRWTWKALGTAALLASVLAYEVTGALFLLTPLVAWYGWTRTASESPRGRWLPWVVAGANLAALAAVFVYKTAVSDRADFAGGYLWRAIYTARESTAVAFGSYGLALPAKVWTALTEHFDPAAFAVSLAVGLGILAYLIVGPGRRERPFPGRPAWTGLLLAGGVLFGSGYGAALLTWDIGFDTTGINNRTAIAAAPGVAVVLVAGAGLLGTLWTAERLRWRTFRVVVAALGFGGCLVVNTIATFWVEASAEQREIVEALRRILPEPPPGSAVLLDGICPYRGPGIVFETTWDMNGMLALTFGDTSLQGDVIRANTELTAEGVRTLLYDDIVRVYPYGDDLRVVRPREGTVERLATLQDARRYFTTRPEPDCPPGVEGYGARIF